MVIDFYVAVPHGVAGRAVAAAARRAGFEVWLRSDEARGLWACVCRHRLVATPAALDAIERSLDRLAAPFGGRSQGWGTYGNVAERLARPLIADRRPWRIRRDSTSLLARRYGNG